MEDAATLCMLQLLKCALALAHLDILVPGLWA